MSVSRFNFFPLLSRTSALNAFIYMKYYLFLWISMNQDQLFSISTTTQSQFYFIIACLLCEFPNHTIILNIHKNWRFSFSTNLCVYFHSILLQLIYFHDFCFLFYFSVTIVVCYFTRKKRQVNTGKVHILRILHISVCRCRAFFSSCGCLRKRMVTAYAMGDRREKEPQMQKNFSIKVFNKKPYGDNFANNTIAWSEPYEHTLTLRIGDEATVITNVKISYILILI